MRGIEAGDLRGAWGASGRSGGARADRGILDRADVGPRRGEGVERGRAYAAFADAIASSVRTRAAGGATSGAGPSLEATALALRDAVAADPSDGAVAAVLDKVDAALAGAVSRLGLSDTAARRIVADFRAELAARVDALARDAGAVSAAPTAATAPDAGTAEATAPTSPTSPIGAPRSTAPTASTGSTATPAPTSAVASASYRVVQKTGIELLTQEGDVVRISLRTKEGFRAAGGYSPTGAYLQVAAYSKTRFTVEVQGSLSAQERAAIDDVLAQVDAIATEFYAGGTANAFATGAALDVDATQLAAVSLRMSQSTNLRVAASAEWSGALPAAASPTTPPPAAPSTSLPANAAPASSSPTSAVPTGTAVASADTAARSSAGAGAGSPALAADASATPDRAATPDTPAAAESTASPDEATAPVSPAAVDASLRSSTLQSMTEFLVKLFDALGTTTTAGRFEFTARAKLQLVVAGVGAAKLPAATTETAAAGTLGSVVAATEDRPAA